MLSYIRIQNNLEKEHFLENLAYIIEDNDDIANLFSRALTSAKFNVEVINDGAKAIKKLEKTNPTLIILDLHLPNVNGITILNHIRTKEHLNETSIIIATADGSLSEYHRERADLLLQKPVTFSQMRSFAERFRKS
jgi:two-component system sensor histidine kinase/response regulator